MATGRPPLHSGRHHPIRRAGVRLSRARSQRRRSRLPLGKQAANRIFIHCCIRSERPLLPRTGSVCGLWCWAFYAVQAACAGGLGVAGGSGHAGVCLADGSLCGACRPYPLL